MTNLVDRQSSSDRLSIKVRLLGPTELVVGDRRFPAGDTLQRGVLATLALRANTRVGAETIAATLWEKPPQTALRQIQSKIWKLCEVLDEVFANDAVRQRPKLINQAGGYLLFTAPTSIDVVLFETLLSNARKSVNKGDFETASTHYRDALSLWRGQPLEDISSPGASAPGIKAEAIKIREKCFNAMEERIETDLILGRHEEVIPELQMLVAEFPVRERFRLHLIRALTRVGRRQEATEVYIEGNKILVHGMGVELSPDLTEAYRVALAGSRPSLGDLTTPVVTTPRGPAPNRREPVELGGTYPCVPRSASASIGMAATLSLDHETLLPGADAYLLNPELPDDEHGKPPAHLEPILEQLLSGATDMTASRRLGLSPRTFSRRVSELLEYLEVASRFQAGAEAFRRGWVTVRSDHSIR